MALLLTEQDVTALLPMDRAIAEVEAALRDMGLGQAENRDRTRVKAGEAVLNVMSAALPGKGVLGVKSYTVSPRGPVALFLLYDDTGALLAVMEADELGRIRTGAATGVATKYMARPDSRIAAIVGTGFQADTQLLAMAAVLELEEVRVYSRRREAVDAFCGRMAPRLRARLVPAESVEAAVDGADVVTTITNAPEPVLFGRWLAPGVHVNAAGSNRAYEREIDSVTVERAVRIAVDSLSQAHIESGDLVLAERDGVDVWPRVVELPRLVAGQHPGRTEPGEITLFKSNGLAVEDVAVARWVYQEAVRQGAGQQLNL